MNQNLLISDPSGTFLVFCSQVDIGARHFAALAKTNLPAYTAIDANYMWHLNRNTKSPFPEKTCREVAWNTPHMLRIVTDSQAYS